MTKITLMSTHVLFTPLEQEAVKSKSGLDLSAADSVRSKRFLKGTVDATGVDCNQVEVGDTIHYPLGSVTAISLEGEDFHLIDEKMIFAVQKP